MQTSPDSVLKPYLAGGEQLLWAGRPRPASRWAMWRNALGLTALLVGVYGFEIHFRHLEAGGSGDGDVVLALGIICFPVVLIVVRVRTKDWRARITYGLTDQRALILPSWQGADVISVPLQGLRPITLKEHRNGPGTITFSIPGKVEWQVGSGDFDKTKTAFEKIDNARVVYEWIAEMHAALESELLIAS